MEIDLKIDKEQFREYVSDKLFDMVFDVNKLNEEVKNVVDNCIYGYNSPLKKQVNEIFLEKIRDEFKKPENKQAIAHAVATFFADDNFQKFLNRTIEKMVKEMRDW